MVTNDESLPPQLWGGDRPRVRATDPITSHLAADKSQRGLSKLRLAILRLFQSRLTGADGLTGSELNWRYGVLARGDSTDQWPKCHPDSPRKRAGELADDGYLDVVGHRMGEFGSEESVYRISPEGRAVLARAAA